MEYAKLAAIFVLGIVSTLLAQPIIGKFRSSRKSVSVDQSQAKAGGDIVGRDKISK